MLNNDAISIDCLKAGEPLNPYWRHRYNQDRPHDALGGQSPVAFALAAVG